MVQGEGAAEVTCSKRDATKEPAARAPMTSILQIRPANIQLDCLGGYAMRMI